MRIISGSARGRKLKQPVGFNIRPTGDKVKESVFTIIQFDIEGRHVLDLFAGTGQFGIEALSRGADSAVFVDFATESVKLIRENLKLCGFSDLSAVYTADALRFLERAEKFDIIFIDPPYDTPLMEKALEKIVQFDKLNINGIIMCESKVGISSTQVKPPYILLKEYRYGSVIISKLTREDDIC
ncbi:MAG: 16S rRNA (guanine(966)-N(2))-methyltransferase RsmD [Oscillospiraceae bacterium]|jgi:16S rRNA (guanine(966)-N(2))-methyltransferase RsmD|nr:16S rRNA (guanine(966)-N(2))-methyltransferase RsmD [Oscillospiraceae bacterium]